MKVDTRGTPAADREPVPFRDDQQQGDAVCDFCLPPNILSSCGYLQLFGGHPVNAQGLRVQGFLVLADLVPIVPGHVLLIPEAHLHSVSALKPRRRAQATVLEKRIGRFLTSYFDGSGYVSFEHGTRSRPGKPPPRVKCASTDHAHRHILPVGSLGDLAAHLQGRAVRAGGEVALLSLGEQQLALEQRLESEVAAYHHISYHQDDSTCSALYIPGAGEDPRQLFRRILTEEDLLASNALDTRSDWHSAAIYPSSAQRSDLFATTVALAQFIYES